MRVFTNGRLPLAHPDKFFTNTIRPLTVDGDGCWLWKGAHNRKGYGSVSVEGKHKLTHRYAWELTHGAIPEGMLVCHRCDLPGCVRPDHLFLGTPSDNMKDMAAKGRRSFAGEANPAAKLTDAQIEEIRQRYKPAVGQTLADELGVSLATVQYHAYKGRREAALAA